ncbi:hypothetical protein [Petroclostridium sp. X23]|uniref:phage portal protein family protein n=1 Tax=Petroclostridium sp. X23 TaxID=3045146 RepID=UPI0024AE0D1E|nr:hypothetical protein [Petroclostridium sp. X23]WHH58298.1 hypothetical protein QKW49_21240 [Petroclostridium sp. X23]
MAKTTQTNSRVDFSEVGSTGLKRWGGVISEEFLRELHGKQGAKVYQEMRDNDPIIGAIMFAIEMLMRQAVWHVEPANENSRADQEAAEFVESCLDDMSATWQDTMTEILTFLPFGWSYHEIVYKRRGGNVKDPARKSKYNDGLIGWRKLPIRSQDTLYQWILDEEDGGIRAMEQQPPPDYRNRIIPIEKALLFRTRSNKGNPEGRSILRNAYRPWYFKRRMEEIEGIGVERNLAGLPVLTPPEKMDIWDKNDPDMVHLLHTAERLVQNIRRDQMEGIVKPNGWELELLSASGGSGSSRGGANTSEIINRYEQRMAMTVLADFILLGHEKVGSFALSSSKTNLFGMAIGAWLDSIAEVFNRYAIPRLFELNPKFHVEDYPKLAHSDIETPDLAELGAFIKDMTGVGVLVPGPKLEAHIRQAADLPEEDDMGEYWEMARDQRMNPLQQSSERNEEPDEEDPEVQAAAKRYLGREE